MDDEFVKNLVQEVKSQGVFDQFRMDSLADVDTKPAYQNVRSRVESAVNDFLSKQTLTIDTNKVQLREKLRKHLLDSAVLHKGVDHIVDQVVNPKVATIFEPKIESIAYQYLGIAPPPPPVNQPPPRPPLLPAPPLPPYGPPMNGSNLLQVEVPAGLLPTDLEQISPDSDRATIKSDLKEDKNSNDIELPPGVDAEDNNFDEETTSPSFERLNSTKDNKPIAIEKDEGNSIGNVDTLNKELVTDSRDAGASQTSQLSQVSSDSRLTIASSTESAVDAQLPANSSVEHTPNITANISEEAQMPKFNENSSDASGGNNNGTDLHFDIKQNAITFEGTERKVSISEASNANSNGLIPLSIEDAIMSEVQANISATEPELPPEPTIKPPLQAEVNDSKSIDAAPLENPVENTNNETTEVVTSKEDEIKTPSVNNNPPSMDIKESDSIATPVPSIEDVGQTGQIAIKDESIKSIESTTSPVSDSPQLKKESQDKCRPPQSESKSYQRSRDREHDKSHSKHSSSSKSKHSSSSSSHSSSSKHKSSKHKSSSSSSRSSAPHESSSSSSKRSSSQSSRNESSSKKDKSSSSSASRSNSKSKSHHRSHSSSRSRNESSSSKRSSEGGDRSKDHSKTSSSSSTSNTPAPPPPASLQDDHTEQKIKRQKRHSHDSNDDSKPPGNNATIKSTSLETTKTTETNGNTNGNSNGDTNGNNDTNSNGQYEDKANVSDAAPSTSNVIILSDILLQPSTSFIELIGGKAIETKDAKEAPAEMETKETPAGVNEMETKETPTGVKEMETKLLGAVADVKAMETSVNEAMDDQNPIDTINPKVELPSPRQTIDEKTIPTLDKDNVTNEQNAPKEVMDEVVEDQNSPTVDENEIPDEPKPSKMKKDDIADISPKAEPTSGWLLLSKDEELSTPITHFEQNIDEFKPRLELIKRLIEHRRDIRNLIGEDKSATDREKRSWRRSTSKRSGSNDVHTADECSISGESLSSSSTTPDAPPIDNNSNRAKRMCRDDTKTSPSPSEASVSSKENEAIDKTDNDDLTKRLNTKLCQQQRYSSEDLYKPRPILSQRSRRRGMDSIQ